MTSMMRTQRIDRAAVRSLLWVAVCSLLLAAPVARADVHVTSSSKWGAGATGAGHRSVSGYLYDTNATKFSCGIFAAETGSAKMYCIFAAPGTPQIYCESDSAEHVAALSAMSSTSGIYFEVAAGGGPSGTNMNLPSQTCTYVFVWNGVTPEWEISLSDPNLIFPAP